MLINNNIDIFYSFNFIDKYYIFSLNCKINLIIEKKIINIIENIQFLYY
jgi:hypothetical protein